MIIFQITLTGPMLQYLAALKRQEETGVNVNELLYPDSRFVTTMQSLIRQNLVSHEIPLNNREASTGKVPAEWKTKGRRFYYEITAKGIAALQLAGFDLQEFLDQVRLGLPGPMTPSYGELYREAQDAGGKPARVGRGRRRVAVAS